MKTSPIYKLCAVTTTIDGYHCTAYARNGNKWRLFDNLASERAKKVTPEEVVTNIAHILVYQREEKP